LIGRIAQRTLKENIMADETPPPPGVPGQPDRRRPVPTIDLEATEIARGPAAAAAGPEPTSPAGAPPPDAAAEPPNADTPQPGWAASVTWPLVSAGLAGAILALGVVWVVTLNTGGNDSRVAEARVAQLERQVADLTAQAPVAHASADAASSVAVSDLAKRLQKLEAQQAQLAAAPAPGVDPALANRIAAVETQLKSLDERVVALRQGADSAAAANAAALNELAQKLARADAPAAQPTEASSEASSEASGANAAAIAALTQRLDALEGSAKTTESKLAAAASDRDAQTSDDHAMRIAVIAAALSAAVERGHPFVAELKAAQAQATDAKTLAPLEGFAATGVPNVNVLVRELTSLEPALLQAARVPVEGGFLEKLQANAERLVRIRPIEEIPGDDPAAVIVRVEIKAMRGDLPGALTELGNLPAPVRAPAQAWVAKAQARAAAVAASRAFAADALVALAQPSR
jgi:hypothetical protein